MTEVLASEWLSGVTPFTKPTFDQSYVLQPTVLPYKPPTDPPEVFKYSEVEKTARQR